MISIASDGLYWPRGAIIYRSLGGAEGGCPEPPALVERVPMLLTEAMEPTASASAGDDQPATPQTSELRPVVIAGSLVPSLITNDGDPC